MIITKLQGGLGNQMFQAATAYALAKHYKTNMKLDLSFLHKNNVSTEVFTARIYELGVFNCNFNIADSDDIGFFFQKDKELIKRVCGKIKRLVFNSKIIADTRNSENFKQKASKYTYLDGYWQNENYFKNYRKEILNLFRFPPIDIKHRNLEAEIIKSNSVSVHFRHGDYVNNEHIKSVHGVCSFNYYQKAIKLITEKEKNVKFFLFSDEPDKVNEELFFGHTYTVIDNRNEEPYIDLRLMSLCKHNIIANSSFSWWGAWLNQNSEKIVVAPKKWFANENNNNRTKDLIPDKWKRI